MLVSSDELLPDHAENIHDAPSIMVEPPATAGDSEEINKILIAKLASSAIDLRHWNMPQLSDPDYELCDKDVWRFFAIDPSIGSETDIHHRAELGSLKLQPRKVASYPADVRKWAHDTSLLISHASAEAIRRLHRHRSPTLGQTFDLRYQEFPEQLQTALVSKFAPTVLASNVSDLRYGTISVGQTCKVLAPSTAQMVYQRLFDFSSEFKEPLEQILSDATTVPLENSSWILALSRFPPEFPQWLADQLMSIKCIGITFKLVIALLFDAAPAEWAEIDILYSSPLQRASVQAFQQQMVRLEPSALVFVQAGASPMKLLKRVKCMVLSTDSRQRPCADEMCLWRPSLLPSFQSAHRLVFDFPRDFAIKMHATLSLLAAKVDGEISVNTYRSLGDTGAAKRSAAHFLFPFSEDRPDDPDLVKQLQLELGARGFTSVAIGWEHSFQLGPDILTMTCDSMDWLSCAELHSTFESIVLASRTIALVKTPASLTVHELKQIVGNYNSQHEFKIRRIGDNFGKFLWRDLSERAPPLRTQSTSLASSLEMGVLLPGIAKKDLKLRLHELATAGQTHLESVGFSFPAAGIQTTLKPNGSRRGLQTSLSFPSVTLARAFFHCFQEHHWQNTTLTHACVIKLTNPVFEREWQTNTMKELRASAVAITPEVIRNAELAGSMATLSLGAPPGLHAVPTPARQNST